MILDVPQTPLFTKTITEYLKQNGKVISLGLGEPEVETPLAIIEAAHQAMLDGYTKYSSAFGLDILRQKIAEKLQSESVEVNSSNVLITSGGKNGLFIAMRGICEEGDEVINLVPCYVSNKPIAQLCGVNLVNVQIDLTTSELDFSLIRSKINSKTKAILVNFPHNPTGKILSESEFQTINELALEFELYVISDEVYSNIVLKEHRFISFATNHSNKDKSVVIRSFSKSNFMTGFRIGYVVATSELINSFSKIQLHLNTNTPTFVQKSAVKALEIENDNLPAYLNDIERRTKQIFKFCSEKKIEATNTKGGLFTFVKIANSGLSSDEFAAKLVNKYGVAVVPGRNFGADYDGYIRVSFTNSIENLMIGFESIAEMLQ